MKENKNIKENLSHEDNARLVIDYFHRIMMHHAMWYAEVRHQLGPEKAEKILKDAYEKSSEIQMKRIAKTLDFELKDGIPSPLIDLSDEKLKELKKNMAINWLANDGVWFQAVEFSRNMNDAKRCNDSCWGKFSPFEAWSVKKFLNLPENSGLDGLDKALQLRLYSDINKQTIVRENENCLILYMNECRVQSARKRKGLDDYPCKSAGLVEYPTFAEAIDSSIKTECIGCPPDNHPEEWYCAWKFTVEK